MPLIWNGWAAPAAYETSTVSPTVRCSRLAISEATTMSVAAAGARPLTRWYGESWRSEIQLPPRVGAPPLLVTRVPLRISAIPLRERTPTASCTPGTARAWGSTELETGRYRLVSPTCGRPFACTATPLSTELSTPSKVERMVSVRTRVPATKVTPRMIAIAVSESRSLWLSRLRRLTLSSLPDPVLLAEVADDAQDRVGGRGAKLLHHPAVGEEDDPVGVGGGERVVGHHDDGLAQLVDRPAEQLSSGPRVEVSGGLVGKDDLGTGDQRPGGGHPLLLAAGHLTGPMPEPVGQPGRLHQRLDRAGLRLAAGDGERQQDVVESVEGGHQVQGLEDEAHALPAEQGELPIA